MRRTSEHQEVVTETVHQRFYKGKTPGEHLNIRRWSQRQSTSVSTKVRHRRTSKHQEVVAETVHQRRHKGGGHRDSPPASTQRLDMRRTSKHQEVVTETVHQRFYKGKTPGEHLNIRRWSQRQSTSVSTKEVVTETVHQRRRKASSNMSERESGGGMPIIFPALLVKVTRKSSSSSGNDLDLLRSLGPLSPDSLKTLLGSMAESLNEQSDTRASLVDLLLNSSSVPESPAQVQDLVSALNSLTETEDELGADTQIKASALLSDLSLSLLQLQTSPGLGSGSGLGLDPDLDLDSELEAAAESIVLGVSTLLKYSDKMMSNDFELSGRNALGGVDKSTT
ncbi:hypothetical protein WMY93_033481 [Mugilogobius chulae]|uniref:Uncharacterized protein n=1 Tax=Mugilogobius chulae TaxID=88201 RepID=A0AAW0MRV3_9GOBI